MGLVKLSVSVPEDLWKDARSLAREGTTSAVVQEALSRWVAQASQGPPYASSPPPDVQEAMKEARERLTREARAEYERGYVQGVRCARRLPWWAIEDLADRRQFKVIEWAGAWADGAIALEMRHRPINKEGEADVEAADSAAVPTQDPFVVVRALVPALGGLVPHYYGENAGFEPASTYLRGFTQAMRDLWSSVAEGNVLSDR